MGCGEQRCVPGDQCWVLKESDFGSREKADLRIVVALIDNRDHYTFNSL